MTEGTENTPESAPVDALVHTPGPWKVRARFDVVQDLGIYGGYFVGSTRGNSSDLPSNVQAQDEANARLIAAAPDLLAHLRHMIWLVEIELKEDGGHIIAGAKAAVEKAISVV